MPPAPDNPDHAAPPCGLGTVLYVEDHPVNVLVMQALFARRPALRLVVATTGEAAWETALAHPPFSLLLLDLHLPDCHGTELLQRLRRMPALADVPAVAVTADTVDPRWAGFRETWLKPLDVHATLARIDGLLALPGTPAAAGTAVAEPGMWPRAAGSPLPAASPSATLFGGSIDGYTR